MGIIYKIENKINHKIYIGQTRFTLERRIKEHFKTYKNLHIDNALRKYGLDNFDISILEEVDNSRLSEREIYWIAHFNCVSPNGYNNTFGGEGGIPSLEVRQKISRALKGRFTGKDNPMYGTISPMRGKVGARKGKKHSKETIQKMVKSRTGENSKVARPIICLETGVYFISSKQASEEMGISRSSISCALNGKQKTAGGYHWIFSDDVIP